MMLVQCLDGKFHKDPMLIAEKWILQCNDDGVFVSYINQGTWRTARKRLKEGGVRCRLLIELGQDNAILKGRLVPVSKFKIRLNGPLPNPQGSKGSVVDKPEEHLLEGEKLLAW